jgi:ABC-type glutathione transport system ATPase component
MDRDSAQPDVPSPGGLRKRCDRLLWQQQQDAKALANERAKLAQIDEYLALAPAVEEALDKLSEEMFGSLTRVLEEQLTVALQEVLDQPDLALKVEREFKNRTATMRFYVERNGNREHIMKGQGGSVANVLSVGLRLFAFTTLDQQKHRRFLVLDEQDCWLRPDLVPALVKMVRDAGRALGFQVIMISHHDLGIFERYADRIYRFTPSAEGVKVECAVAPPPVADSAS